MKEPRIWEKDGVGHIEVPMPDNSLPCDSCGATMHWHWLYDNGPGIANWWPLCPVVGCKRGPTIIRDLKG